MPSVVSPRTRDVLTRSLPLLQQHERGLIEAVEASFLREGDNRRAQASVAATLLTRMLVEQARAIVEFGFVRTLARSAAEQAMAGIDHHDYVAYGDVLVPILRDLTGGDVPPAVTSAWVDTYWAIIGMIPAPTKLAA